MGFLFSFLNLEERCIHHTNMFSTFTHPSLLKYGQSQGRASILIAILSFPSFRKLYIERSLYTEVQNEEPVAATERPDSFVPLLPSMQKCVSVLQYSAKSWQHTKHKVLQLFPLFKWKYTTSSTGADDVWGLCIFWTSWYYHCSPLGEHIPFQHYWLIRVAGFALMLFLESFKNIML